MGVYVHTDTDVLSVEVGFVSVVFLVAKKCAYPPSTSTLLPLLLPSLTNPL